MKVFMIIFSVLMALFCLCTMYGNIKIGSGFLAFTNAVCFTIYLIVIFIWSGKP